MKKFDQLGRNLSKEEQKKVTGGLEDGTCTVSCPGPNPSYTCSSTSGDCGDERNGAGYITKISCDGRTYNC